MVKLDFRRLREYVLSRLGARCEELVVGPEVGEDAAVIEIRGAKYVISHTDPITGAVEHIGWLSVHVPANDVATQGGVPRWFEIAILLPERFPDEKLDLITRQIDEALRELGSCLIGGHTEYAPEIRRPIVVSTCIGYGDKYVRTGGAREGDLVIMTKGAAVEGTSILSSDFESELRRRGVPDDVIRRAKRFIREVSVVREALAVRDYVSSMHDPTEGGVLQGAYEIACASGKDVEIWLDGIIVREETRIVFNALGLDPLRSLSSGSLLACVPEDKLDQVESELRSLHVSFSVIGRVIGRSDRPKVIVRRSRGSDVMFVVDREVEDEIMRMWQSSDHLTVVNT